MAGGRRHRVINKLHRTKDRLKRKFGENEDSKHGTSATNMTTAATSASLPSRMLGAPNSVPTSPLSPFKENSTIDTSSTATSLTLTHTTGVPPLTAPTSADSPTPTAGSPGITTTHSSTALNTPPTSTNPLSLSTVLPTNASTTTTSPSNTTGSRHSAVRASTTTTTTAAYPVPATSAIQSPSSPSPQQASDVSDQQGTSTILASPKPGHSSRQVKLWNGGIEKAKKELNAGENEDLNRWLTTSIDSLGPEPPQSGQGGPNGSLSGPITPTSQAIVPPAQSSPLDRLIETVQAGYNQNQSPVRDNIGRFLGTLRKFAIVGDTMLQHNPSIVALAWGGFRFLLEVRFHSPFICQRRAANIVVCSAGSTPPPIMPPFLPHWRE